MPETDLTLDLSHVAKTYRGRVRALRGIAMRVHRGEIFGLLGPNGAGKSTLVKILMTVIRPTRCDGTLLGRPVGDKPTLARVGYLPEHHRFPDYLTGAQVIDFYGGLSGVPRATRRKRADELLELVGMRAWARKRVRSYSKGMRQRIGIAQALVNDPDLVLLDEPTDGVDPVGRRDIREICLRLRRQGKTVFINSHLLSELEQVCDRVAILVQGLVASQGTIDELTRDRQGYVIEAAMPDAPGGALDARALLAEVLAARPATTEPGAAPGPACIGALHTGERVEAEGGTIRVGTADAVRVQPLLDALRRRGAVVRALRPVRPSLEDLFMQAVTDPSTGEVLAPGAESPGNRAGRAGRGGAR